MTVSAATVAAWGRFDVPAPGPELDLLGTLVAAGLEHLGRYYRIDDPITATQSIAVNLQVARWWARRDTPEGRAAFGGDVAVTVTSFDADVDAMLQPKPGIA